jgi:hypothetical protein
MLVTYKLVSTLKLPSLYHPLTLVGTLNFPLFHYISCFFAPLHKGGGTNLVSAT